MELNSWNIWISRCISIGFQLNILFILFLFLLLLFHQKNEKIFCCGWTEMCAQILCSFIFQFYSYFSIFSSFTFCFVLSPLSSSLSFFYLLVLSLCTSSRKQVKIALSATNRFWLFSPSLPLSFFWLCTKHFPFIQQTIGNIFSMCFDILDYLTSVRLKLFKYRYFNIIFFSEDIFLPFGHMCLPIECASVYLKVNPNNILNVISMIMSQHYSLNGRSNVVVYERQGNMKMSKIK